MKLGMIAFSILISNYPALYQWDMYRVQNLVVELLNKFQSYLFNLSSMIACIPKYQMPFSKCSWSFRYFWELLGQCFQDAPAEHCYLTWRPPFYLHYRNINVNEVDKRHGEVVDKIAPTGSVLCGSAHHSYDQVICWRPPIQCSAQQRKPKNRKMHNVTAMWLMWLQCDSLRVLQSYALRVWDKLN